MIDFKSTILIVDDMQVDLALLSAILQDEYNIKTTKSAKEGMEILSDGGIDLILLDVVMPEMDGYEMCSLLKKDEKTKNIPVIFVTGSSSEEDEEKGFELGAVDYILKPFKPTTIKNRVKTHINLRQRQNELETIFQTSRDGIAILDLETNFLFFNDSYLAMTGFTKETVISIPTTIFIKN